MPEFVLESFSEFTIKIGEREIPATLYQVPCATRPFACALDLEKTITGYGTSRDEAKNIAIEEAIKYLNLSG